MHRGPSATLNNGKKNKTMSKLLFVFRSPFLGIFFFFFFFFLVTSFAHESHLKEERSLRKAVQNGEVRGHEEEDVEHS
jgi:hypothetical protein